MTDAKYSPGPWKSHPIEKRQGLPYVPVSAETLIARVYSKHFGDDAQAAANGRLIAAAPELFEALDSILWAEDKQPDHRPDAIRLARAAIAKATGSNHD